MHDAPLCLIFTYTRSLAIFPRRDVHARVQWPLSGGASNCLLTDKEAQTCRPYELTVCSGPDSARPCKTVPRARKALEPQPAGWRSAAIGEISRILETPRAEKGSRRSFSIAVRREAGPIVPARAFRVCSIQGAICPGWKGSREEAAHLPMAITSSSRGGGPLWRWCLNFSGGAHTWPDVSGGHTLSRKVTGEGGIKQVLRLAQSVTMSGVFGEAKLERAVIHALPTPRRTSARSDSACQLAIRSTATPGWVQRLRSRLRPAGF